MWEILKIDQSENEAGSAGSAGSQESAPSGIEEAAAAAHAAGANPEQSNTAAPETEASQGKPAQTPAEEQMEIIWNGQKKMMSREEVIAHAQRAYNVTQREQEISKTKKDLAAKLARLDELVAEAEKGGQGEEEDAEANEPINKLSKEVEALRNKAQLQEWEKAFNPVQQKYPDISEKALLTEFQEKVQAGEVDDNAAGLMKVAENIANEREGTVSKRLDDLLKDPNNPKLKAYTDKVIADYIAGKRNISQAGGEPGGSAAGAKPDTSSSISDIAEKLRTGK